MLEAKRPLLISLHVEFYLSFHEEGKKIIWPFATPVEGKMWFSIFEQMRHISMVQHFENRHIIYRIVARRIQTWPWRGILLRWFCI